MKNYLLIFLFAFGLMKSQNLTLNELINLRKKDLVEVEEYLNKKVNWTISTSKQPDEENYGYISFDYNKDLIEDTVMGTFKYFYFKKKIFSKLSDGTISEGTITSIYEGEDGKIYETPYDSFVNLTIFSKDKYNNYLNGVKLFNPKLIESKIDSDGTIVKIYQGATMTFVFKISKIDNNRTGYADTKYSLTIFTNNHYDYIN